MNRIVIIFSLFFVIMSITCCKKASIEPKTNNLAENNEETNIEITATIKENINADLPDFIFKIHGYKGKYNCEADKITIYHRSEQNEPIQILEFETTQAWNETDFGFVAEDMNFDGYKDIRIQQNVPVGANIFYLCWIYNPKINKFEPDGLLSSLSLPSFDPVKKIVSSYERGSAVDNVSQKYVYIDNQLTLKSEVARTMNYETGMIDVVEKELINGKLIIIKETEESPE